MDNLGVFNKAKDEDTALQKKILPWTMTREDVVTSGVVYETAHIIIILSRGLNEVSSRVLGFLCALLRAAARGDGPAQECAARARELLCSSGCLQDMLDMFLGATENVNMETTQNLGYWKVLCESLIESCRDCEHNQKYCSGLIAACIQRCDVTNIEILKLLHCLLLNNPSNINIFVECNGTSIFTKESIHESSSMELLSLVVQNASAANLLKRNTDLMASLFTVGEDYKQNCQGSWKIVELASVALFHLASHVDGMDNSIVGTLSRSSFDYDTSENISETSITDLSVSWEKVEPRIVLNNNKTKKQTRGDHTSHRSSIIDFVPKFMSTPKRRIITTADKQVGELRDINNSKTLKSNIVSQQQPHGNYFVSLIKKTLSRSSRLFNIVNNSRVSIYNTVGTIFRRNPADPKPRSLLKQKYNINEETNIKFTNYMKQRVLHAGKKFSDNLNVQKQSKRKLALRKKNRQSTVNKLKSGMHFYGCNFKKIAQTMWSHEKQMTPKVLYIIYRKYIVK